MNEKQRNKHEYLFTFKSIWRVGVVDICREGSRVKDRVFFFSFCQVRELKIVLNKFLSEQATAVKEKSIPPTPVRITRSVGLQVALPGGGQRVSHIMLKLSGHMVAANH